MREYNPEIPLFSMHIPKCGGTSFETILEKWFNNGRYFPNLYRHPRILKTLWKSRVDLLVQSSMGLGFVRHSYFHILGYPPRIIRKNKFRDILTLSSAPICIHGHFDPLKSENQFFNFYPNAQQFITMIRDPLDMEISMYHYRKKFVEQGGIYFKGEKRNLQVDTIEKYLQNKKSYLLESWPWKMGVENYKEVIEKHFVFIGILEKFDTSIRLLAEKLGKKFYEMPKLNSSRKDEKLNEDTVQQFKKNNQLEYMVYEYVREKYFDN